MSNNLINDGPMFFWTVRIQEKRGSPINYIVLSKDIDDAIRLALLLHRDNYTSPAIRYILVRLSDKLGIEI